jgi:hypothetical protein
LRLTFSWCLTRQKIIFLLKVRRQAVDSASVAIGKSLCGLEFGGGGGAEFGSRRLRGLRHVLGASGWGAFVRRNACLTVIEDCQNSALGFWQSVLICPNGLSRRESLSD